VNEADTDARARMLSKPWHERCGEHHGAGELCPADVREIAAGLDAWERETLARTHEYLLHTSWGSELAPLDRYDRTERLFALGLVAEAIRGWARLTNLGRAVARGRAEGTVGK
jgi:hypothetical protein